MLVTCVCILIGEINLGLCPWLSYQAFEEAEIALTRASTIGFGRQLKTHRCCRAKAESHAFGLKQQSQFAIL